MPANANYQAIQAANTRRRKGKRQAASQNGLRPSHKASAHPKRALTMRWLPFLLVILSAFAPVELLASTVWAELGIRSTWSVMLCLAIYYCLSDKTLSVILICESLSIAYNLAIALGYYFADKDLSALYEPLMIFLFFIELYSTLPWRTRRDSRDIGKRGDSVRERAPSHNSLAASNQVQVAQCKV